MFYVIYVLAILCGTGFCLKIHIPPMGMAVANQEVPISWTRQSDSDPTSVMFLLENLIGGDKTASVLSTSSDSNHTTASMKFPVVGTFRMWAVNPADTTQAYAMSKPFTVTPNNNAAAGTNAVNGDGFTSAGDGIPLLPPPDSPASADSSEIPGPTNSSLVDSSKPTTSSKMMPLIVGAVIGGVILLLLLGALIYVLRRRRARAERRTTFHRNRMVKSMPPPTFAVPHDSDAESDLEDEKPGYGYGSHPGAGAGGRRMEERAPTGPYPFARTA